MMKLRSKLPHIGDTIFTEMSALARQSHSINLGQGFPDYQPHEDLVRAVCDALREGDNQYAPMIGIPDLRAAIADKIQGQHGHHYDEDAEITVTAGATEALMCSLLALTHAGDEVILIDPAYDLYAPGIEMAGAVPIRVPMQAPDDTRRQFRIDWSAIENAITKRTRMLVLNFPHNPTGIVLQESDLDILESIVERHSILLLSDEAYEHIVFDGEPHRSISRRASLAARGVLVSSFGKTFHATGWRIGYCCAPAAIMREIRKVHQYTVFSVTTPIQHGIVRYLRESDAIATLGSFYQKKRDRLVAGLENTPLQALHSAGTFFLLVSTRALGDELEKDLAIRLTHDIGVTTIPVSAFYADPGRPSANHQLLRLCFAKQDSTLDAALERLQGLRPQAAG